MLKKFKMFEASLKDNPGLPSGYIDDYAKKVLSTMGNPRDLMGSIDTMLRMQEGKEKELEVLGKKAIEDFYGSLLDNVEIDAKIVIPGEDKKHEEMFNKIKDNQKKHDQVKPTEKPKSADDDQKKKDNLKKLMAMMGKPMPETKEEDSKTPEYDEAFDIEVAKRKIINTMIQGESFNIFDIISLIKDDIENIEPGLFDIYKKVIDESYKQYWLMPEEAQLKMFMNDKNPNGNFVEVGWKKKDEEQGEGGDDDEDEDEGCDSCQAANDALKGEDFDENAKEALNDMYSPSITVRALDLPCMIHETVKGILELIFAHAIGEDKEFETRVATQVTSYSDEIEDLKFGPKIAADIRDFMNKNTKIGKYPNLREFVFGKMVNPKILASKDFLKVIKGILSDKPEDADLKRTARVIVDRFLDETIQEFEDYEEAMSKYELSLVLPENEPEEETNDEEDVNDQIAKLMSETQPRKRRETPKAEETPVSTEKFKKIENYMDLQKGDFKDQYNKLDKAINQAFDDDDMATVKEIGSERVKLVSTYKEKYGEDFVPRTY